MATTQDIISKCLTQLGEKTPLTPTRMTRADVLFYINLEWRGRIAEAIRDITFANLTFTSGIATLPTDWLKPERIYDGDAPTGTLLERIFDIGERVGDTEKTTQYYLPDSANIWIFGKTPTTGIKAYYVKKPAALTDSALSTPTALKEEYHIDIFVARIKEVYADRKNNYDDAMDYRAKFEDYLEMIRKAHKDSKEDRQIRRVRAARWW